MKINLNSLAALAALIVTSQSALAQLRVTEVMQQTSSGTTNLINGDWWELTNFGPAPVDLSGYHWADSEDAVDGPTQQPNFFPSFVLNSGQSVIILEEVATNEAAWRLNWHAPALLQIFATDEMLPSPGVTDTFSGLGSGGDAVYFYNPSGTLLSSYSYGATTRGTSFEADSAGNDLGLSVLGEYGAYQAANNDIGSPGIAVVPEPSALSLGALGLLGLIFRQRIVARQ